MLAGQTGAHGRDCTDTVRVLGALSLRWTTWANTPGRSLLPAWHPQGGAFRATRARRCKRVSVVDGVDIVDKVDGQGPKRR